MFVEFMPSILEVDMPGLLPKRISKMHHGDSSTEGSGFNRKGSSLEQVRLSF